jgi:hypothetical protein
MDMINITVEVLLYIMKIYLSGTSLVKFKFYKQLGQVFVLRYMNTQLRKK